MEFGRSVVITVHLLIIHLAIILFEHSYLSVHPFEWNWSNESYMFGEFIAVSSYCLHTWMPLNLHPCTLLFLLIFNYLYSVALPL